MEFNDELHEDYFMWRIGKLEKSEPTTISWDMYVAIDFMRN